MAHRNVGVPTGTIIYTRDPKKERARKARKQRRKKRTAKACLKCQHNQEGFCVRYRTWGYALNRVCPERCATW